MGESAGVSLNAVQQYVSSALDGMTTQGLPNVMSFVQPPVVTDLTVPSIFVWGSTLHESRLTLPRFRGEKRVEHNLTLWLKYVGTNDVADSQLFPVFLDNVRSLLRALPLPIAITDSVTGEASTIIDIGEKISQEYGTPVTMEDQRYLAYGAAMKVLVIEHIYPA